MSLNAKQTWKQIEQQLAERLRILPKIIGEEVVNFSLDRFKEQAWTGNNTEPWKKRKLAKWGNKNEPTRKTLVKTGALRRSIRITKLDKSKVVVGAGGSDIPYAKVHNFGFRGQVKQTVRPFTRRMKTGKTQNVKGFNRTLNMNIPKRQFIGGVSESRYLKKTLK